MLLQSQIRIREAKTTDAGTIASLMGELDYPTTQQQMRNRLLRIERDPTYRTFVCEADGAIVGVVGVRVGSSYESDAVYAHILVLVVTKLFRSRGVGQLLLNAAEKWATKQGASKISVTSHLRRTDAHEFYERELYLRTGHRFTKDFSPSA